MKTRSGTSPGKRGRPRKVNLDVEEEVEEEQEEEQEGEGDDEEEEEDDDEEEDSSSEEEVVFNITERRKRATAGRTEKVFAGKAKEDHEAFWNDNNFAEEEHDSEISFGGMSSDEENLWEDSEDSDISRSDQSDIDAEDEAALEEANKEALAADKPARKSNKGGFGKYKDPRFKKQASDKKGGKKGSEKRKSVKKRNIYLMPVIPDRQMRASTQVKGLLAREAQTERLAEHQKRREKNRAEREKRNADKVEITHEQRILNMEVTEKENAADLKRLLAAQMDKVYKEKKDPYSGPAIKWVSRATKVGVEVVKDDEGDEVEKDTFEAREYIRFENEDPKQAIELFCEDDQRWEERPTEKQRVKYFRSPVKSR